MKAVATGTLSRRDGHLMSQSFKFQQPKNAAVVPCSAAM
jgi:hypothetical protein